MQYWNSIGPILKQYWNNSLPENLSRISEKGPGSRPAKKRSPAHMREHLRECVSGRGVKSQSVGCGAKSFLWTCAFSRLCHQPPIQGKGPCNRSFCSTLILKGWMSFGTALKQYWSSTGTIQEQYWNSTETVLEHYWNSTGTALKQYRNSIGCLLYTSPSPRD